MTDVASKIATAIMDMAERDRCLVRGMIEDVVRAELARVFVDDIFLSDGHRRFHSAFDEPIDPKITYTLQTLADTPEMRLRIAEMRDQMNSAYTKSLCDRLLREL